MALCCGTALVLQAGTGAASVVIYFPKQEAPKKEIALTVKADGFASKLEKPLKGWLVAVKPGSRPISRLGPR